MKKWTCVAVATIIMLTVMSGCSGVGSSGDEMNYLRLDGATANIPLAIGFYQEYYNLSQEEAEDLVQFSKSSQSYLNFLESGADLLLVSKADTGTQEIIDQSGIQLEYIPLRRDALCFIVNEENPVDSLTDAQIKDIYQGKILSWEDVGGEPWPMIAFQRNEDSGSQAMMRRLVMDGLEMIEPRRAQSMGEMLEEIAEYYNAWGAIGYTTYYFADEMYRQPEVKFLQINGIAPTERTIGDGTYPYLNENNIVIRDDAKKNSEVRKAVAWLKSNEGKRMMESLNYIPVD